MKIQGYFFSIAFLGMVYLYMLFCNFMMPYFADDYMYSFDLSRPQHLLSSFGDVVNSMYIHYFTWTGRVIGIGLTQLFLWIGKPVFNYLNAFMFILLMIFSYWISFGKVTFKFNKAALLCTFFFLWTSIKAFGETTLWLNGACAYLWPMVFILIFLLPYRLYYSGLMQTKKTYYVPLVFFLGILAGCSNENTGLSNLLIVFVSIIYFYRFRHIEKWMIAGLIGAIIGYALLIAAPGNFVKAALTVSKDSYSIWRQIEHTFLMLFKAFIAQIFAWIPVIYCLVKMKKNLCFRRSNEFMFSIFFVVLSVFNNAVMVVSPDFPNRATFGSSIFLIIGAMSLLHLYHKECAMAFGTQYRQKMIALFCVLFTLVTMSFTAINYSILNKESMERIAYINWQKSMGNFNIVLKPYSIQEGAVFKRVFIRDIEKDSDYWTNKLFQKYYQLESVSICEEAEGI